MPINLPESSLPRVVIVGAGFAGLTLARRLDPRAYQVVLIDRNNFHQFQPLLYQVAMSGIEPSAIAFPLRKLFRRRANTHIRVAEVEAVDPAGKFLHTSEGRVNYDTLVLATGVETNFFGNPRIQANAYALKSVADALYLRNAILSDLEKALTEREYNARQTLMDIAIVGGGPTGVEMAGSLAEMKRYILPKEYPELHAEEMDIFLIQAGPDLLNGMSPAASRASRQYLEELGVNIMTGVRVTDYDGIHLSLSDGRQLAARKVIWAAGITGHRMPGLPDDWFTPNSRLLVDGFNRIAGTNDLYALGDNAHMEEGSWKGHPQVAQPAIQQARLLADNLNRQARGKAMKPFRYRDLGSLATIGRHKAVADLPGIRFQGVFAWIVWLVVHLKSILGVKNKLFVLFNWVWSYFTFDQSLRIIVRHRTPRK
jgi:NADH dehydrogenase